MVTNKPANLHGVAPACRGGPKYQVVLVWLAAYTDKINPALFLTISCVAFRPSANQEKIRRCQQTPGVSVWQTSRPDGKLWYCVRFVLSASSKEFSLPSLCKSYWIVCWMFHSIDLIDVLCVIHLESWQERQTINNKKQIKTLGGLPSRYYSNPNILLTSAVGLPYLFSGYSLSIFITLGLFLSSPNLNC